MSVRRRARIPSGRFRSSLLRSSESNPITNRRERCAETDQTTTGPWGGGSATSTARHRGRTQRVVGPIAVVWGTCTRPTTFEIGRPSDRIATCEKRDGPRSLQSADRIDFPYRKRAGGGRDLSLRRAGERGSRK